MSQVDSIKLSVKLPSSSSRNLSASTTASAALQHSLIREPQKSHIPRTQLEGRYIPLPLTASNLSPLLVANLSGGGS